MKGVSVCGARVPSNPIAVAFAAEHQAAIVEIGQLEVVVHLVVIATAAATAAAASVPVAGLGN